MQCFTQDQGKVEFVLGSMCVLCVYPELVTVELLLMCLHTPLNCGCGCPLVFAVDVLLPGAN